MLADPLGDDTALTAAEERAAAVTAELGLVAEPAEPPPIVATGLTTRGARRLPQLRSGLDGPPADAAAAG
jgi:hypothetical protein